MALVGYPRQPNIKVHLYTLIFSFFPTVLVAFAGDGPQQGQGQDEAKMVPR